MNPSSASKAAVVTAISPSSKTLRLVKVQLIHLYCLNNLQQSSTYTSSSDAASDSNSKTVSSRSSTS